MATTLSLPSTHSSKSASLEVWMERVLDRADGVRKSWDADAVHDLRVALRRCRTIAEASAEVNPRPGWHRLKKSTRELFHDLGALRDTQVQRALVKKLAPASDPVRKQITRELARREKKQRHAAERALEAFDRKNWKKLTHKLAAKSEFFPLNSVVYHRLALARLNAAASLLQLARRRRSAAAWHKVRIGIKSFRYLVENFMPLRYEAWEDGLKHMQDLLGDVHDLDVLRMEIVRRKRGLKPEAVATWREQIDHQRKAHLKEFLAKSSGPQSRWIEWRAGLQLGHTLAFQPLAQRRTA